MFLVKCDENVYYLSTVSGGRRIRSLKSVSYIGSSRPEGMTWRVEVLAAKSDGPSSNPGTPKWKKRTDSSK